MAKDKSRMRAIPIGEVKNKKTLPFDIYIRVGEDNYVKVAHKNINVPKEQLEHYEAKKVGRVYISSEDYHRYITVTEQSAQKLLRTDGLSKEVKMGVLGYLAQRVFIELESLGFTPEVFQYAKKVVHNAINIVESDIEIKKMLEAFAKSGDQFMAHAMAVAAVAIMIGKAQGWTLVKNFEKIAIAGFFHDIGLKQLSKEIQTTPINELNDEQLEQYKKHPALAVRALEKIPTISKEVLTIVGQHHEYNGMGFPLALRDTAIHPSARLVALADHFCDLTLSNPQVKTTMSPEAAIFHIIQNCKPKRQFRDSDVIALKNLVLPKSSAA